MACFGEAPHLISSRIRSQINTLASTAIPSVRTIPAIPGSVSVDPITLRTASSMMTLTTRAIFASRPKSKPQYLKPAKV